MSDEPAARAAWQQALTAGGAASLLVPLAHYRITPYAINFIGFPPGPEADAFSRVLDPLIGGALLSFVVWAGAHLRSFVARKLNDPTSADPSAATQVIAKVLP
jgi:hypothetical protein